MTSYGSYITTCQQSDHLRHDERHIIDTISEREVSKGWLKLACYVVYHTGCCHQRALEQILSHLRGRRPYCPREDE